MRRKLHWIHTKGVRLCPAKLSDGRQLVWNYWLKKFFVQAQEWAYMKGELGQGVKHKEWSCGPAMVHFYRAADGSEIWTAKRGSRWVILTEEEIRRAEDALLVEHVIK